MLVDVGVHVNWGMIFHKSLVDELRHVAKKLMGPTPIGPFLTKYIQRWFDYLDKNQKSPPIRQIQDVFTRLEMSRYGAQLDLGGCKRSRPNDTIGGQLAIIGSSDQWKAKCEDMESKLLELMEDFVGLRSGYVIKVSAL
jgi:hypothetical protein